MFCCCGVALATGCGSFADAPEKKFAILSFSEDAGGMIGAGDGGGGVAGADIGGGSAGADIGGGGAAEASDVEGPGPPKMLDEFDEQPAASGASNSNATSGARARHGIG